MIFKMGKGHENQHGQVKPKFESVCCKTQKNKKSTLIHISAKSDNVSAVFLEYMPVTTNAMHVNCDTVL